MNFNLITDYINDSEEKPIIYCKAILKKDYYFMSGDEFFYRFIGSNSIYNIFELIHPDDLEGFKEGLNLLEKGPQSLIARLKAGDGNYYYIYFVAAFLDKVVDGFHLIELEICDFMNMKTKFKDYTSLFKKYKIFMSLIPYSFYEYSYKTDTLKIFKYLNQKATLTFEKSMDEYLAEISDDKDLSQEEKIVCHNFCDSLRLDTERFEMVVPAKSLSKKNFKGMFKFKGTALYRDGKKEMNTGIVETTEIKKTEKKYYMTDSAIDPGTGIFNKRAINEYAVEKIKECGVKNSAMYLAVLDIDDFKKINDSYGHITGDKVLAGIAETIQGTLDYRGSCGRFGGDEFMVVFDKIDNEQELRNIIKVIYKKIALMFCGDNSFTVTTSWGISRFPDNGHNLEELFEIADKSLYIAKKKGKNRFIIYDEKKHGDFSKEITETRKAGVHALASVTEKASVISNLILELNRTGAKSFLHVMETMSDYFDLDGISIYEGKNLKKILSFGNYGGKFQDFSCAIDENYPALFNENGIFVEGIIDQLKNLYPRCHEFFTKQEISKFVQFLSKGKDSSVIISYDYFNRSPKIGDTDLSFMVMVGKLMAQILTENNYF